MAIHTLHARLRRLSLVAMLFGIGAVGLAGQPSAAQSVATEYRLVSSPEISSSQRKAWTREELLNAVPYPLENVPGLPLAGVSPPSAKGPAFIVPPQFPKGSDGKAAPQNPGYTVDPSYYGYYPFSTMGKVFFTDNGVNYVCSAAVAGNNAVWTAGHCVFNPQSYTWHTNWIFVPGYYDGYAPHGYWYARELWTNTLWTDSPWNNFGHDIAAAVLWPDANGNSVATRFGALGFMANVSYSQYFEPFGYAALYPYNGERIAGCGNSPFVYDYSYSPPTIGVSCDLTGGASGGPWLVSGYYINGLNSYKYTNDPYSMYSPYFGDTATMMYNTVLPR